MHTKTRNSRSDQRTALFQPPVSLEHIRKFTDSICEYDVKHFCGLFIIYIFHRQCCVMVESADADFQHGGVLGNIRRIDPDLSGYYFLVVEGHDSAFTVEQ